MFKHSKGVIALGVCLAVIVFARGASAQIVVNPVAKDSDPIRSTAQWDKPFAFVRDGDIRRLESGANSEKHSKIQIGPVELESRKSTIDAPWRQYEPYFEKSHAAFSWSFDIHRNRP